MSALFLLIAASLSLALGFLVAFIWAVRSDQYDDPESPAMRMLFNGPARDVRATDQDTDKSNLN
jgi:cbb3-type cytochrome oxidase maturation protein